ncbi:MAG: hypothetical protein ACRYG4_22470, partial [Janthinobacterium lividum]
MRARAVRHSQPIYWREAAICVPAMPVILLAGAATGHIVEAAIAAGAAFSVGFGAARDLRGRRWGAMIAAALGMTVAAFVGSLFGESFVLFLILAAIAAAACAATALIDEDLWWVALQVVVFLLIAGYYAGPPAEALTRALAVLAGGAAQLVSVVVLAKLVPRAAGRLPGNPARYEADRTLLIVH